MQTQEKKKTAGRREWDAHLKPMQTGTSKEGAYDPAVKVTSKSRTRGNLRQSSPKTGGKKPDEIAGDPAYCRRKGKKPLSRRFISCQEGRPASREEKGGTCTARGESPVLGGETGGAIAAQLGRKRQKQKTGRHGVFNVEVVSCRLGNDNTKRNGNFTTSAGKRAEKATPFPGEKVGFKPGDLEKR